MGDPEQGKRIRKARAELGLSQQDFAELIGLETGQAVSNLERGETALTSKRARRLADVTGKPVSYYLDPLADQRPRPTKEPPDGLLREVVDGVADLLEARDVVLDGLRDVQTRLERIEEKLEPHAVEQG